MTDSLKPGAPARAEIDRNLALELVRATEAAALAASRHLGRGDKDIVDQAAVDAMRPVLNTISMRGTVVIGEGEKDEAPMLYNGEDVGDGTGPEVDFAVDPVDGTTLTAKSLPNALAIVAVAERHWRLPLPPEPGRRDERGEQQQSGTGEEDRPVAGEHRSVTAR